MAQVFVSRMPACSLLGVSTKCRLTSSELDACNLLDALLIFSKRLKSVELLNAMFLQLKRMLSN